MKRNLCLFTCLLVIGYWSLPSLASDPVPYGSSEFVAWKDLQQMDHLKVAWDFNFDDPASVARALNPVSYMLKATHEYGPVNFEPLRTVVVSHGGEVAVWAKKNYAKYKDIVDRAASMAHLGVRFEVCSTAAQAQGFDVDDFHGFIKVVPTGSFALVYWSSKGYAVVPAGSTVPSRIINEFNRDDLARKLLSTPRR